MSKAFNVFRLKTAKENKRTPLDYFMVLSENVKIKLD
jgi:hypothetical protein